MNKARFLTRMGMVLVVLMAACIQSTASAGSPGAEMSGETLYVVPGGAGDCSSWANACELQKALGDAVSSDQIWVAAGTYKPTATSDRAIAFHLKSGVGLYGGFPAGGGTWASRNWKTHLTTLSGDIGTSGVPGDNSFHVVAADSVNSETVLDGFTITGGNANDASEDAGGGMLNEDGSPTLHNLIFSGNAAVYGGGLFNVNGSPLLTNIIFSDNHASTGGGGMVNYNGSNPTLIHVIFIDNHAVYGGGLENYENNAPELFSVTFSGNEAENGGGIFNNSSSPELTNVTISGNMANYGAGIYNYNSSHPILTNVTIYDNEAATQAGGIYNSSSNPTLTNSIVWANTPNQIANASSTPVVTYCDIQNGYAGQGNIVLDPLLGGLAENGGFTQTHALLDGSPAIDTGSPSICPRTDQRGYFRPIDGDRNGDAVCDMGAYEYGTVSVLYLPLVLR